MEETISLKEIFEVIKKRLLLIIAFVLGAAVIAAIISYFVLTPTYQSSSQFIVNQGQQDPNVQYNVNDIRTNVEIINTYNVVIKSPAILEEVVDELNLPYTSGALSEKLQVSSEQNSQVVTVTATDEDPALAVQLANTTVSIFQDKISDIMNVDNVSVLSQAELSENPSPVAPNPMLNIAIAIVIGAMVGVGISFLLEYLDNTITTEEDIENKIGLPVLGIISHIDDADVREDQFKFQAQRTKRGGFDGAAKKSI
ncbi:YveK family protein [Virgibacillus halodenitrificans]|uniref:Capsular biosynthesis protein n=1 Tax=Virgibacillus halodenitrificans TaxID=1482 RepID=A0ABR7VHX5_VIRHA|nr:Wzz/FepE/Etk N-terminal domain-containing protein [Virgibacillus halodenitrificans]MBD1221318.1 capsular biosynthesis protein [Virgibacillus halodenitrificans]